MGIAMRILVTYQVILLLLFNSAYAHAETESIQPVISLLLSEQSIAGNCDAMSGNRIASGSVAYTGPNIGVFFLDGPISYTYDENSSAAKLTAISYQGFANSINAAFNIDLNTVETTTISVDYDTLGRPRRINSVAQAGSATLNSVLTISYGANGAVSRISGTSQNIHVDGGATIYDLDYVMAVVSNAGGEYISIEVDTEFLVASEGVVTIEPIVTRVDNLVYNNDRLSQYQYGVVRATSGFSVLGTVDFSYSGCFLNRIQDEFLSDEAVLTKVKPSPLAQNVNIDFSLVSSDRGNLNLVGRYDNIACSESTQQLDQVVDLLFLIGGLNPLPFGTAQGAEFQYLSLCQ